MTWWHAVVEARHELMNPTSPEKIRLLGERLGLGPDSHVLDIASGSGGPALLLAETFGCRLTCVERAPEFVATARERTAAAGLADRIEIVEADAATYELGRYDAALCIGATFVYGGLVPTLERLRPVAPLLAVGEPYWRVWPLPPDPFAGGHERTDESEWLPLLETVERIESTGVRVVSLIASAIGIAAGLALDALIPSGGSIPFVATPGRLLTSSGYVIIASLLGCAFSLRRVLNVDPAAAIGGGDG